MAEARFQMDFEACAIVQVEAWPAVSDAFETEMARKLGGSLPAACGEAVSLGGWQAIRIALSRFWLIAHDPEKLQTFRTRPCAKNAAASTFSLSIDPQLGCSLPLGESRIRLRLRGPHIFDVLKACVAVDWDAPEAAPGRAIQTSLHNVPLLALRTAADACDLLLPRSFAQSLAEWVAEIATPFETRSPEAVPA